jgi:hypothetical protein
MGLIVCPYHGDSGIVIVCYHIRNDIIDRKASEGIIKMTCPGPADIDERFRWDRVLYYCLTCVIEYDYPAEDSIISSEQHNRIYDNEKFPVSCFRCLKELNKLD